MITKIKNIQAILKNMGLRYVLFRMGYAFQIKTGVFKRKFPVNPPEIGNIPTLDEWRKQTPAFFFQGKKDIRLAKKPTDLLRQTFEEITGGTLTFFNKPKYQLGKEYDWITNPDSGYRYDIQKHWSEIEDLSAQAGDIKYVWEKARFSYLYDIIRYDYHHGKDCAEFVFSEIKSFIAHNPINQGPNYKCSQETSIRVFNWTFALYYYKDSEQLTDAFLREVLNHIYWQIHHVYHNIQFSRIAVRNNHALTETLMLYLSGLLFPFFLDVARWSSKGKKWFEKEIAYQIYEDGTFLQFSMNYHRVAIQLLTWAIRLSSLHRQSLHPVVYDRARKSIRFLEACSDVKSGKLPNYGPNDGALFFKLTDDDYRVYRSQLNDLKAVLDLPVSAKSESYAWYGLLQTGKESTENQAGLFTFQAGGYYLIKEKENAVLSFLRCGAYRNRPFQNDNLHLDIWVGGINYLRDSGSYKYNTSEEEYLYFNGCRGHNTLSIDDADQMLKGPRFVWFNWVKKAQAKLSETDDLFLFVGEIDAFKHLRKGITHRREVRKSKNKLAWSVTDTVTHAEGLVKKIYWHLNLEVLDDISIEAYDRQQNKLIPVVEDVWYSGYYGLKEKSIRLTFSTNSNQISTQIKINHPIDA